MWRLPSVLAALTATLLQCYPTGAISFPLYTRSRSDPVTQRLLKRVWITKSQLTVLKNYGDKSYYTNITVGGNSFQVLIDTGSTDLWVNGYARTQRSWGWELAINYADGEERGIVSTADVAFDDFVIPEQAYINVTMTDEEMGTGIIGLGPTVNSRVRREFNTQLNFSNDIGDPPLERIFKQDPELPNFLTVLLSRKSDDLNGPDPYNQVGQLTIGRLIYGLHNIVDTPKLPVPDVIGWQRTGHWQTELDANGIFGPDGQYMETISTVPGGDNHRLNVVFDTGYSLPQLPAHVIHSIYGRIPGAKYVPRAGTDSGYYKNIPCNYELNVTFAFGGLAYPIHPLDLTHDDFFDDEPDCISTFQTIPTHVANHSSYGPFDGILGMAFLRNVYFLVDYGDYIDGNTSTIGDPYIQLLALTDVADGHADFVKVRMGGKDTSASQAPLLPYAPYFGIDDDVLANGGLEGGAGGNAKSTDPNEDATDTTAGKGLKSSASKPWYRTRWFYIGVAVVGGVLVILAIGLAICLCLRRRRRSYLKTEPVFVPPIAGAGAYNPINSNVNLPATQGAAFANAALTPGAYTYSEPKYQFGPP